VLALSMAGSNLAVAQGQGQGPGQRDDRGRGASQQRDVQPDRRADPGRQDNRNVRRDDRRDGRDDRNRRFQRDERDYRGVYRDRGAGPSHAYRRGDRLPTYYRSRIYVVDDWRGHRLSSPPRGYHWVQSGGDYLLVAVATGVILQLILMGQ
jgi:Ni/Co efflux regulator RcnB